MRGSTPRKRQKHLKIRQKQPKNSQNYLYISIFLWTRTGELSDASSTRRNARRDHPTPKKRMLGLTPSIFFRVEPPKTPKQVFGDKEHIYM